MLKEPGFCICSKPTKKVDGRQRWRKTCGSKECSHRLQAMVMITKDENGVSKADKRSIQLHKTQMTKDPEYKLKWAQKVLATLGEDGLVARGRTQSKTKGGVDKQTLIRYRNSVSYYTRKQDLSDLPNFEKLKDGYQIDHILSVVDGFKNGLTPKQVAHKANLQVLSKKENRDKWMRSDMTVHELLEKIKC